MPTPLALRPCVLCGRKVTPRTKAPQKGISTSDLMVGRGLCALCYQKENYHGRLEDYPRGTVSRDALLTEYEILRELGYTWRQCAIRLDMKYPTFERAMCRARKARDPRARRIGEKANA